MPLLAQFDTPARLRDLPAANPFYRAWHTYVSTLMGMGAGADGDPGEFFNGTETNVRIAAARSLVWMGLPRERVMTRRDDRRQAFIDADARLEQDEYLEWRTARDASGKITKVTFVTETPDYWSLLYAEDPATAVRLYNDLVDPTLRRVTSTDLAPGGAYDGMNRWNTVDGIVHYIVGINTLSAAIGLARGSVSTPHRDNFEHNIATPVEMTSADPRVTLDVGTIARKGLAVSLEDPIGLYIADWDDTGWTKPNGSPVGNYWRITRGSPGFVLRLEYEVPAAEGFVVGDIRIGGRPIRYGSQIAEHVTVKITGIAGTKI